MKNQKGKNCPRIKREREKSFFLSFFSLPRPRENGPEKTGVEDKERRKREEKEKKEEGTKFIVRRRKELRLSEQLGLSQPAS